MAVSKLELAVDSGKWDAGIRKAQQALRNFANSQGGMQQALQKNGAETMKFISMMGKMESTADTTRGRMAEYKATIEKIAGATRFMNDEQKKTAQQAVQQLTDKLRAEREEADKLSKALNEAGKNTKELKPTSLDLGGIVSDLGSKFGVSGDMMKVMSGGAIGAAAAIGAVATAAVAATKAFAEYNKELSQQTQIAEVTLGIQGPEADKIVADVRAISKVYKVDYRESINAVNTMMTQFKISSGEAMSILRDGMQGMISGDCPKLLQMIQQYAPAFRDAGLQADQLVAIIHNTEGGIFTDENMNAIMMGIKNIRVMKDATKETMKSIGIDADDMAKKLNDGSLGIFEALQQVASKIEELGPSSQAAGQIMNDIFGKQGVAAGQNLGEALSSLNLNLQETKVQTGEIGQKMAELAESTSVLEEQMQKAFGVKTFEEFSLGIKTYAIEALTGVLVKFHELKDVCNFTDEKFQAIKTTLSAFKQTLHPIIDTLATIASYFHDAGEEARIAGDKWAAAAPKLAEGVGRAWMTSNGGVTKSVTAAAATADDKPEKKTTYTPPKTPKTSSHSSSSSTTKNEKTEEQKLQEDINKAVEDYVKIRDKVGEQYDKQRKQLQQNIDAWTKDLEGIKKAKEEAKSLSETLPVGSIAALTKELNKLKAEQNNATNNTDFSNLETQIKAVENKIKEIKGEVDIKVKLDKKEILSPMQQLQSEIKLVEASMQSASNAGDWKAMSEHLAEVRDRMMDINVVQGLIDFDISNKSIDLSELNIDTGDLWQRALNGENISDETWKQLENTINEKLKELNLDPIKIDPKTGKIEKKDKEEKKFSLTDNKYFQGSSQLVSGISSITSSLQSMGVEIPKGLEKTITIMQGVMGVIQGVQAVISAIQVFTATNEAAKNLTLATIATGVTTIATTSAIGALPFFANGGFLPHAANGIIKGTQYSADNMPVLMSAGEAVINQADQYKLFSILKSLDDYSGGGATMVRGQDLFLCMNNYMRSTGMRFVV